MAPGFGLWLPTYQQFLPLQKPPTPPSLFLLSSCTPFSLIPSTVKQISTCSFSLFFLFISSTAPELYKELNKGKTQGITVYPTLYLSPPFLWYKRQLIPPYSDIFFRNPLLGSLFFFLEGFLQRPSGLGVLLYDDWAGEAEEKKGVYEQQKPETNAESSSASVWDLQRSVCWWKGWLCSAPEGYRAAEISSGYVVIMVLSVILMSYFDRLKIWCYIFSCRFE